ncbi:hypothetical protein AC579_1166 [Pseudocercospora musae]|uniref:Arginyl-tRNA--protein transferase 1 n=1 Tax=Pseudocercospora musae TaxID=113226 RepID=A0A139H5K3_9PEZI|nr:hypothetical protein AC579_1166 [Pseudocercospora musae]KXS97648.1 hypothetical protein AC579_1166 [Pseudocercospora musae]
MRVEMSSPGAAPSPSLSLLTPIVLRWLGYHSGDCGYCKAAHSNQPTPDSRASYYARTTTLTPEHYQQLMDRGWRRSGSLLYIPDASRSCCPHYTIRLLASEFKPSRDQRQAINRWNHYVTGESYLQEISKSFPKTKEEKKRQNEAFNLLSSVHEAESSNLKPGIHPDHALEVTLEPDEFTEEKFKLFDNYQRHVHHDQDDDITRSGFKRFLCDSPLVRRVDAHGKRLGSYHQCYRLDGRLIAMAVLDLLPHAVSGVYFLYHSDFEKWSFGKLSALREAALALEDDYDYYYMGYYIHSCRKMRYKGDYKPQHVLDLNNMQWFPLNDELRHLMETRKWASLSKEQEKQALLRAAESGNSDAGVQDQMPNRALIEAMDHVLYPTPLEAMHSGLSLLQLGMPGVMTLDALQQAVDLDAMKIFLKNAGVHPTQNIVSWDTGSPLDKSTLKGLFAEFAAAVGPDIARDAIVDFS